MFWRRTPGAKLQHGRHRCALGEDIQSTRLSAAAQDTLSLEQRAMLDMDYLVMHRVLDPVQVHRAMLGCSLLMFLEHS